MKDTSLFEKTRYGKLYKVYDFLDFLNFGNVSRRSRNYFLGRLPAKLENPLIVGCGTGDFAVSLLNKENPKTLTINDLSNRMIMKTREKILQSGWQGCLKVLEGSVTDTPREKYDFISLNYVLNLFEPNSRSVFLKNIVMKLSPLGLIQVADFSCPASPILYPLHLLNWWLAVIFFWIFSGNKPNRLGNMETQFQENNLSIVERKKFVGGLYSTYLLKFTGH